eukprot:gene6301-12750_t
MRFVHLILSATVGISLSFQNGIRQTTHKPITFAMKGEYDKINTLEVLRTDGRPIKLSGIISPQRVTLVSFLTHFADFNSWELTQRLRHDLKKMEDAGVNVVCVGIGSSDAATEFCKLLDFPPDKVYADETAACHRQLGFSSGPFPNLPLSPIVKLGLMLGGIGSPGTINAVVGGYFGSSKRTSDGGGRFPTNALGKELSEIGSGAWDSLGKTGLRPFELATLRLQNMMGGILDNWELLAPKNQNLVIQQGGSILFDGVETAYRYDDKGILTYTPIDEVLPLALNLASKKRTADRGVFKMFK